MIDLAFTSDYIGYTVRSFVDHIWKVYLSFT